MFCKHSTASTVSFKQTEVETELVTSIPSELQSLRPDGEDRWTIKYRTTITLFYPGRTTTITKTTSNADDQTFTTTFATYIPPSTVLVVKTVVAVVDQESLTSLCEFNIHGLWSITMSLFIVAATLIFMVST